MLFKGGEIEKYDKVHLTPFGEYVLFRRWLFFVKKITDEIGDFTPGERSTTSTWPAIGCPPRSATRSSTRNWSAP